MRKGPELRPAVFLDRDGVINAMVYNPDFGLVDSPQNPEEFELLPGAADGVRLINKMGYLTVVVSNQPGIAKGKHSPSVLKQVTEKMENGLAAEGARLDAVYYCLHHPDAALAEYRAICDCRKPMPGLLLKAASELSIDLRSSYMIGDGMTDVLAGRRAGCRTVFLGISKCEICKVMETEDARPDFLAKDLGEAASLIRRYRKGETLLKWHRQEESCKANCLTNITGSR